MLQVENAIKEYEKIGSEAIFSRYFKAIHELNTEKFCDLVDALPAKQPDKCINLYAGPISQGLAGGFSFLISFAESFSMKIISSDLNNPVVNKALLTTPTFSGLRIFLNFSNSKSIYNKSIFVSTNGLYNEYL